VILNAPQLTKELYEETISVIIKYDRDAEKVLAHLGVTGEARKNITSTANATGHYHGHYH